MKVNNIKPNIYKRMANYIEKSKTAQNVLRRADSNPSLFNAGCVFVLATTLRPSATMIMPTNGKDGKRDELYASARSIGTGVLDLAFAIAVFVPLTKIVDKATTKLFEMKNTAYFHNKEGCTAWKSVFNRGAKIALLPIIAYLNFATVKPIADFIVNNLGKMRGKKNDK